MKKTTFRIFDCQAQKYIAPTDKSNFSLSITGEVVPPKKTPADSKFEVAYSLPMLDINGKQPFTDDDVIFISGAGVEVGTIGYSEDVKSWECINKNGGFTCREFQILPNREDRAAGQDWENIFTAWNERAAARPEPINESNSEQTENTKDPLFYRTREYAFGDMRLAVTLSSEVDMPEEMWDIHLDDAMKSTDVFIAAHPEPKVVPTSVPTVVNEPAPVKYEPRMMLDAKKLVDMEIAQAPMEWNSIRAIAQNYPNVPNCQKVLNRYGNTDLVQWYIGRHDNFNVASEVFLITKTPVEDNESPNVSK